MGGRAILFSVLFALFSASTLAAQDAAKVFAGALAQQGAGIKSIEDCNSAKGQLTLGVTQNATLGDSGSCFLSSSLVYIDLWTFFATAGQTVRVTITASFGSDTLLGAIQRASDGVIVAQRVSMSPVIFDYTIPVSATYYVGFGDLTFATGGYSINVSTVGAPPPSGTCAPDSTTNCLLNGRFQVRVNWQALNLGTSGVGTAVAITSDTGYFWFFSSNNIELVVKVLDGRAVNNRIWVFYGALSDVQYTITVTDTATGVVRTYTNRQGTLASFADTSAF